MLLGALEDRVAVGTMNRGGLAGAAWELDDRFTAYDPEHLVAANLDAGKMLLRIDGRDPGTVPTLARLRPGGRRAQRPADAWRWSSRSRTPRTPPARRSGTTTRCSSSRRSASAPPSAASSAYTWLKIQATADIATVAAMTTQPLLLLGGAPGPDPAATFAAWEAALAEPTVRGLVVGRALLYPAGRRRRTPPSPRRGDARRARRGGQTRAASVTHVAHPWYLPAGLDRRRLRRIGRRRPDAGGMDVLRAGGPLDRRRRARARHRTGGSSPCSRCRARSSSRSTAAASSWRA